MICGVFNFKKILIITYQLMFEPKIKRYHQSSRKLTQQESQQRYQTLLSLYNYFPYIFYLDKVQDSYYFPNQMLKDLQFQLKFIVTPENRFTSNSLLKKAYLQIEKLNLQAYQNAYQQYNQQLQSQYAQQPGYNAVDYGYNQIYQGQNNPNYQYNQGQYYNQYQNQHARNYERRNQQGGNYRQGQRYNQGSGQNRYQGINNYNRTGEQGYKKRDNYERVHHQNHRNHHQGPYIPQRKFLEDQAQYSSDLLQEDQVTQPEPVIQTPPPPPPKLEPKPTKFSIIQIKDFINTFSKQELQKHANPEILSKVKQLSEWKCEEVEIEFKQEKRDKNQRNKPQKKTQNTNITFRPDRPPAPQSNYKGPVSIVFGSIGAKQSLGTRQMKEELKKKATDFVEKRVKEDQLLDSLQKNRKEIVFNLNLIVPENLKDVEKDLLNYLFEEEAVCRVLVQETIKKAWDQPKYASTYARLCQDFSKINPKDFKFQKSSKKEKDNPFKLFVIEFVQNSFDQKIDNFPAFESQEDQDQYLKDFKKRILSNVKFIAELIICKVLKKGLIKRCISQMFQSYLNHYYAFAHDKKIEDSVYIYHYEAIIDFIENIGEKYDSLDEKDKQKQQKIDYNYNEIQKHVQAVLKVECPPNKQIIELISFFTADQYFNFLKFIDQIQIKKKFPRLSALLQNLVQRRQNKWEKHLSMADGPKKLKQIQEDIDREERGDTKASKQKKQQEQLDKKVKEMFQGWEINKHEQIREMKDILRKNSEKALYLSLMRQVAQQSKDIIIKRVNLFPIIMDYQKFKPEDFKNAWTDIIKQMTIGGEDFPFCTAAFAKILAFAIQRGQKLSDFHRKYQDEQQTFFSEEVIHKYYFYTKDEDALKFITPKAKYRGLL